MQHEWINVGPQFTRDEWNLLRHQAAHERHVTAQLIEFGHSDFAASFLRCLLRCLLLRAAIPRVRALAGLDLGELGGNRVAFAPGKLREWRGSESEDGGLKPRPAKCAMR